MRPMGSGGVPASAALPRLDHARRHGRRRGALPLPARRSERDPCYHSDTLLGACPSRASPMRDPCSYSARLVALHSGDMSSTPRWTALDALTERYRRAAGSSVEHDVRPYFAAVDRIEAVGAAALSLASLTTRAAELRARCGGEPLEPLLPEVFAVARELA